MSGRRVRGKGSARPAEAEAAGQLRRLLGAVERGEIEAGSPSARALLRRMEGAAVALERTSGQPSPKP